MGLRVEEDSVGSMAPILNALDEALKGEVVEPLWIQMSVPDQIPSLVPFIVQVNAIRMNEQSKITGAVAIIMNAYNDESEVMFTLEQVEP